MQKKKWCISARLLQKVVHPSRSRLTFLFSFEHRFLVFVFIYKNTLYFILQTQWCKFFNLLLLKRKPRWSLRKWGFKFSQGSDVTSRLHSFSFSYNKSTNLQFQWYYNYCHWYCHTGIDFIKSFLLSRCNFRNT